MNIDVQVFSVILGVLYVNTQRWYSYLGHEANLLLSILINI